MVKNKEEPVKKEDKKNQNEKDNFDWENAVIELQCPTFWKAGLKDYIINKNIKINSEKEFKNIVKQYANVKIGE